MDSALAMIRAAGILWVVFALMVSFFFNQLSENVADRYAHAAAAVIQNQLTNAPQALAGGTTGCSRIPTDADAWDRNLLSGDAAQFAWNAAIAADLAIGQRVQDRPRFIPTVDNDVAGRAGFVSVAPGGPGEECELYVRVEITPLGTRFPLLKAQSIVCTHYADHAPPRPCTPAALTT